MNTTLNRPTGWSKYFAIFLALMPILDIYGTGIAGVSVGKMIILVIIIVGFIFKGWRAPHWPKGYMVFFLYMLIIPQIIPLASGFAILSDVAYKSVGTFFFALCLGFAVAYIRLSEIVSAYKKVVVVCCVFFLIQEITYFALGHRILGLLTFLPLNYSGEVVDVSRLDMLFTLDRSSSFFLEPAHFAQFLSLYLILSIVSDRKNFLNFSSVFISLVVVLLRSGNGYLILVLVWAVWLIRCLWQRKHLFQVAMTVLLIAVAGFYIKSDNSAIVSDVVNRVDELSYGETEYTSGFVRIYRGYYLYGELSTTQKIFGIGQGNLQRYFEGNMDSNYAALSNYDLRDMLYINGIQQTLVYGGVIGFLLFLMSLWNLFKGNTLQGKTIVFAILVLCAIGQGYTGAVILLLFVVAALFQQEQQTQSRRLQRSQHLLNFT